MVISLDDGTTVTLEVENARTIKVFPQNPKVELVENQQIKELTYSSEFSIKTNEPIVVDKLPFNIQKIEKLTSGNKKNSGYYLRTHKLNKTSQFIVPLLGLEKDSLLWDSQFCNAFIGHYKEGYGEAIYLLYRFESGEDFNMLDELITSYTYYDKSISPDSYHILFKLEIPSRCKQDIEYILEGKYSFISQEAKLCILNFFKGSKESPMGQILYKGSKRKAMLEEAIGEKLEDDAELLSMFNYDDEVYLSKYQIN